tara:strand:+ start:76 stop:903 length:828 start_codon:yes stop_codon:yes gene_type:complete
MPRKKRVIEEGEKKKNNNNIMKTMTNDINDDHIILQLPINKNNIYNITNNDKTEPIPYDDKDCYFYSDNKNLDMQFENLDCNVDNIISNNVTTTNNICSNKQRLNTVNYNSENKSCCYWCVHPIEYLSYGMPISHDFHTNTYSCHGFFCSLECANAYNFSINSGSDKVWEINSLIQMMARVYNMKIPIRPSPSRYLLNIFDGGTMDIVEYRKLHKVSDTSHILNLPPMVGIISGYEKINTSYIKSLSQNIKKTDNAQYLPKQDNLKIDNIFKNKN